MTIKKGDWIADSTGPQNTLFRVRSVTSTSILAWLKSQPGWCGSTLFRRKDPLLRHPQTPQGYGCNMLTSDDWVAHPHNNTNDPDERKLIDRRADIIVYGYVQDAEACYSFDDYALISLDGEYYLLNTSGCSCPSPTEEWGIVYGPTTLDEMAAYVLDDLDDNGYGVTNRQHQEFVDLIVAARLACIT